MTNEETIKTLKKLKSFHNGSYGTAIDEAIKALEQQTCDCISRAKALEMLGDEPENWTDTEKEIQEVNDYRWFKSILEELPPVTPQPFINKPCVSEGVCREDKIQVLDKIRAEIIELRSRQNVGVMECLDIIDKYKTESETRE